ncbi:MAG: rRNA maturation RNase YbeY [Saccharospirillum sp.]|nr:rRNA maturation RNase YbeY [Saccharospirillum sp.]
MNLTLDIQVASSTTPLPDTIQLQQWVAAALRDARDDTELSIRLVDEAEARTLNRDYRGKDYATNVLSFPFELPPDIEDPEAAALLGDLVLCAPVVAQEAVDQDKPLFDHWAHLVVHGTLHLLGHDHIEPAEADAMEALEVEILNQLGIANPY